MKKKSSLWHPCMHAYASISTYVCVFVYKFTWEKWNSTLSIIANGENLETIGSDEQMFHPLIFKTGQWDEFPLKWVGNSLMLLTDVRGNTMHVNAWRAAGFVLINPCQTNLVVERQVLSNINLIKMKNITSQGPPCTVTAGFSHWKDTVWPALRKV